MPTVQVQAQLSSDDLLYAVEQLNTTDLQQFIDRVLLLRAERVAPHLSKNESELLLKINEGLPEELWRRSDMLNKRRRAGKLTPEEHAELIALNDKFEEYNVRRIGYLVELAQLRRTTLDEVIKSLGIGPRRHA